MPVTLLILQSSVGFMYDIQAHGSIKEMVVIYGATAGNNLMAVTGGTFATICLSIGRKEIDLNYIIGVIVSVISSVPFNTALNNITYFHSEFMHFNSVIKFYDQEQNDGYDGQGNYSS